MTVRAASGSGVLYGARKIAEHLGVSTRIVYFLTTETRRVPHFRVGRVVCARREDLDAWLEAKSREGLQNGPLVDTVVAKLNARLAERGVATAAAIKAKAIARLEAQSTTPLPPTRRQ